jgi:hypothetical protein
MDLVSRLPHFLVRPKALPPPLRVSARLASDVDQLEGLSTLRLTRAKKSTMPLAPDKIAIGRCYRTTSYSGSEVQLRVIKIANVPVHLAEATRRSGESFAMKNEVVLFQWRAAAPNAQWSASQQQQSLANFALWAEAEISCE